MSKTRPLFTVVMPAYGVEKYLAKAVESIESQTFQEWELIIVEDGSPDKTGSLAEKLKEKDARIRVIHHEQNKGLSEARNTGIQHAAGRYIWFMDPDDTVDMDLLQQVAEKAQEIYDDRMKTWNRYYEALKELEEAGKIEMPVIPEDCVHNAHMFYIKARDLEERQKLIGYLKENGIISVFHYIPLHTAPAGMKYGEFRGEDKYTTTESERLLRLPMYYGLEAENVDYIAEKVKAFYSGK